WGVWGLGEVQRVGGESEEGLGECGVGPDKVGEATRQQDHGPEDTGRAFRVALAELAADVHRRYEGKKREGQKLDSTDLLLRTEAVLDGLHGPAIVRKLTARYRFLFVDEFQDTDPVQLRIVERLEEQLERVLLVG